LSRYNEQYTTNRWFSLSITSDNVPFLDATKLSGSRRASFLEGMAKVHTWRRRDIVVFTFFLRMGASLRHLA